MGMPRAANRSLAVTPAGVAVARTRLPMPRLQARREVILHAYQEREPPAWPHPHIWGLSGNCVQLDQKKVAQLPPFWTTLVAPDPEDATSTTLDGDELWSFVLKKANDSWMRDRSVSKEPSSGRLCSGRSE